MTEDTRPAVLPEPPYYAVVFTSLLAEGANGYHETARDMFKLVQDQPGYLGTDSVRGPDGFGITVAYFRDEESIAHWRANPDHAAARRRGRESWYDSFAIHIAKVERAYRCDR